MVRKFCGFLLPHSSLQILITLPTVSPTHRITNIEIFSHRAIFPPLPLNPFPSAPCLFLTSMCLLAYMHAITREYFSSRPFNPYPFHPLHSFSQLFPFFGFLSSAALIQVLSSAYVLPPSSRPPVSPCPLAQLSSPPPQNMDPQLGDQTPQPPPIHPPNVTPFPFPQRPELQVEFETELPPALLFPS